MRLFVIYFILVLFSCKKKCPAPDKVEITHSGPVVVGWPLKLETTGSMNHLFRWYGPNGWKIENAVFSSEAHVVYRQNLTLNDGGEYKVQRVTAEGCVEYEGTVTVSVIEAPNPPCAIAANSSSSSVGGVGSYSFVHKTFGASGNNYLVSASQNVIGDVMKFGFYGSARPIPGVHKTINNHFASDFGTVGIYIEAPGNQFMVYADQEVYVTLKNGKLSISFCNLLFSNPYNQSSPIKISANITEL